MALHTLATGYSRDAAQAALDQALRNGANRDWWYGGGHLYSVFLQPVYFGAPENNVVLGVLVLGFEIDKRLAEVVARVASCQVAFRYGNQVVVSTLSPPQQQALSGQPNRFTTPRATSSEEIPLGDEVFLAISLKLADTYDQPVELTVLKSFDAATRFVRELNRLFLGVGVVAIIAGSWLIFVISDTFTRPLANLVAGVRALEQGNFEFPLHTRSRDEVAELTVAFDRMRKTLQKSQQELLHAERLATIGRMASSISHDLRHPLTTILAYSEYQSDATLDSSQRKSLYEEIRAAVSRMTELISSLLEFSRGQDALRPVHGDVAEALERTTKSIQLRPEFKAVQISVVREGPADGWFDFKKLERAFYNLLQNACEAAPPESGKVQVLTRGVDNRVEVSITDNGPGIPESIRADIFQPFVTYGKESGTGLGLAVAQKIVQDHGGEIRIDATGAAGTTFKMLLPRKRLIPPGS
jgi:signal transduction histidine kinase